MTILEMIAEWCRGCSCAEPGKPETCPQCTVGLIEAIERKVSVPLHIGIAVSPEGGCAVSVMTKHGETYVVLAGGGEYTSNFHSVAVRL